MFFLLVYSLLYEWVDILYTIRLQAQSRLANKTYTCCVFSQVLNNYYYVLSILFTPLRNKIQIADLLEFIFREFSRSPPVFAKQGLNG